MRKHCGNCANHRKETNTFSEECGMCVQSVFENGEKTDPSHWREKPQTNADRIRAMSDEELAKWLVKKTKYQESAWSAPSYLNFLTESDDTMESAIKGTAEWLKQPADMRGEEDG